MPLVVWNSGEDAELGVLVAVHRHDGGYVTATVTVVGGRPYCYDGLFGEMELSRKPGQSSILLVGGKQCGDNEPCNPRSPADVLLQSS